MNFLTLLTFMIAVSYGDNLRGEKPDFEGEQAYRYLIQQCEFGPRVPGTAAHQKCLAFLSSELKKYGALVSHQTFSKNLLQATDANFYTNVIASFGVNKPERILLCAHWDTRPWADQDSSADNQATPIIGANDGASGVAVLLEIARNIQKKQPRYGVDIILFDGEDSGIPAKSDSYALGSQFFAKNKDIRYRPKFGILLDMVGDKDLQFYQEENSLQYAPKIVDRVWQEAQLLGLSSFIPKPGYQVTDDHLPLLKAGIPCIDIIDFDYKYWHTLEDTPDKCSAESLAEVGKLVLSLIYEE